ncbi:Nucleotide-binding universal stress protein, UspA family [Austwickia chelonae]|uniref:UspA domain-containing protein n=1 Tax=Austwickia chelonae NBRC 105200 TaxID=1184607 RepID=K6VTT8_9MICO|nr:universal stress protein [Austwickia chelonae]GAB78760.1 hypothetical protein AUCHE_16_01830 [Austwickia chelonae NBRC 105200]SEW35277.1 Nucleotide-binding universal stress protein, UspA family [Austwickia chelonae]
MNSPRPRVLIGYDDSEQARHAIGWAADYARARSWPLEVVTARTLPLPPFGPTGVISDPLVVDDGPYESALQQACADLKSSHPEVDVTYRMVDPTASRALIEASAEPGIVVIGTRGLGAISSLFLGGVADQVVTHARGPVVVIPEHPDHDDHPEGPVVVGYVSEEHSTRAVDFAAEQADVLKRPLHIATAWDFGIPVTTESSLMMPGPAPSHEVITNLHRTVSEVATRLVGEHPGLDVHVDVQHTSPVELLVGHSRRASMVVVGSRGHGGFTGLLLGSTSRRVLQHTESPAVVVPGN